MRKTVLLPGALCLALLAIPACSRSSDPPAATGPTGGTVVPVTKGDTCIDPQGDLGTDVKAPGGSLSEPAGIDIVKAEALVSDTNLKIVFTMAGSVDAAEAPTLLVEQGVPGQDVSWELRAAPLGPGTPWTLRLITYHSGRESDPVAVAAPVTVAGNTVSFEVPLKALPPIATLIWQFGSTSGNPEDDTKPVVFDDCSGLSQSVTTTTTTPGSTQPVGTTSTTAAPVLVPLGTEQTGASSGRKVTVYEVRSPATTKPLAVPPDEGNVVVAVDVQVCAGSDSGEANVDDFKVKTTDNRQWGYWNSPQTVVDPSLPKAQVLPSGDCVRGWVPVQVPAAQSVTQVLFDDSGSGRGPFLLWKAR